MRVKAHTCDECGQGVEIAVMPERRSRKFYVGTRCGCGPYSRETASTSLVGAISAFERVEL